MTVIPSRGADDIGAGAPANEIKVTREMLDAGREPISSRWLDFTGPTGFRLWDEVLSEVFQAMMAARPR
jgi:hypothetical protein